jgi:hypothetical protein
MVPSWVPSTGGGAADGGAPGDGSADGGADGAGDGGAGDGAAASGGGDGSPPPVAPATPVNSPPSAPTAAPQPSPIAPAKRFNTARRNLSGYSKSGDTNAMRRGVGNFVRGWGGNSTATRRMGGTVRNAAVLHSMLSGGPGAGSVVQTDSGPFDRAVLQGRNAREIIDAVVEAIRPGDGTLDAEASRRALDEAMTEVLTRDPNADLFNLNDEQREHAVEVYVASDVARLFELDLGPHIQKNAPNATMAMARLKEVRAFIRETVAASFRKLKAAGSSLTGSRVNAVVQAALRDALAVFEGYAT